MPQAPAAEVAEKTAFVLAGGGAKGAFEAGAIHFVVEELGIGPDVITATSAGAIVGAVLAQARDHDERLARTAELRRDLLAMSRTEAVFGKQAWLAALDGSPLGGMLEEALRKRTRPAVPGELVDPAAAGRRRLAKTLWPALRSAHRIPAAARGWRQGASSLLTLDPLEVALRGSGDSGIAPLNPALVARPGLELRMAVTALGAGVLRYVTEDGGLVEEDAVTPVGGAGGGPVDLIEGILASASVPMIFPPRPLADDVYADGGVLQNVPVLPALRLGARRVIGILAVPLTRPADTRDYRRVNMVGVFLRTSAGISFAERQLSDVSTPLPDGARLDLIDPVLDIVGPFEVAPALMGIDTDYGWLRAADVLLDLDAEQRLQAVAATHDVITARTRSWHLEERIRIRGRIAPDQRRLLGELKAAVAAGVARRRALGVPNPRGAKAWGEGPEGASLGQGEGVLGARAHEDGHPHPDSTERQAGEGVEQLTG